MSNQIFGPYQTNKIAISAVNILELKGYKASNITIFSNGDNAHELDYQTDVTVESKSTNNEFFKDKITNIFRNNTNSDHDMQDKLINYGLSNKQATKYMEDIQAGEVLVIVDDELRLGNDAASNVMTMKVDTIRRK